MNIEIKTINLKDSYNYFKDTFYILNKNILMTIFYFKIENQTINIFMNNFYYSFSALFTFIALNDILGLSKVQRRIKDKVYNKNLKIT